MKKKLWAGVVGGTIEFFNSDPQGNVEGLSGTRPFTVESNNNELKFYDTSGNNLISNTSSGAGDNVSDVTSDSIQHGAEQQPTGGAAQQQTSQTPPQTA